MSKVIRNVLAAALAFALPACGVKLVDLGPAPNLYDIQTTPQFTGRPAPVTWQLVIDEPIAPTALDSDRILVRPNDSEIKYFAGARWSERVPRLIQSQLLQGFDKSGAIVGVSREAIGLHGDYELQGELTSFDTVYSGGTTPMTVVSINFKIVREPGEFIIASKGFEAKERATAPSLIAITASFSDVLSKIVSQAVPWTLTEAQADYERTAARARTAASSPAQSP
jgi:cholesterol transport system auxiliary component